MLTVDLPGAWIGPFFLMLTRMGGLMVFAPFLSSAAIPPQVRIILSIAFTFVLFPLVQDQIPQAPFSDIFAFGLAIAGELLIGLLLGLVGQLFLASLQVAGQVMGLQMGFGVVNIIDPQTQVESPVLSIFFNLIGILLFLALNTHHWFIKAIVDSYQIVPDGGHLTRALFDNIILAGGEMFVLGLKLAAPVIVVLFIVDILLGIIGRMAPQIHLLVVGMPAKSLLGFAILSVTFHAFLPFLARHMGDLHQQLYTFLGILGR